jgi:CubicO group peptidase (beta-lactamase class C family)
MWIASCTKLMTAVAVLQCVEKGLLHLDDDISTILSEWKDPRILVGFFDDATGAPILEKATKTITLRMLLTHQSGMGYTFTDPKLEQFTEYKKRMGEMKSGHLVCDLSMS